MLKGPVLLSHRRAELWSCLESDSWHVRPPATSAAAARRFACSVTTTSPPASGEARASAPSSRRTPRSGRSSAIAGAWEGAAVAPNHLLLDFNFSKKEALAVFLMQKISVKRENKIFQTPQASKLGPVKASRS